MKPDKKTLLLPILLITIGIGWLLSTLGVAPKIDWIWTLGLAATGFLAFAIWGFDKATIVIGPFFLAASLLSVLRQTERITMDLEVPILVIFSGVLLLFARMPIFPSPKWMIDDDDQDAGPR
jgi:hypothetical protein